LLGFELGPRMSPPTEGKERRLANATSA